jgi:hypothetical protein
MAEYYLIGLVLKDLDYEGLVIEAWAKTAASGITALDCEGMSINNNTYNMDDVPMFPSLSKLLDSRLSGQKFLFTIVEGRENMQIVLDVTVKVVGDLTKPGKGILFAQPLSVVIGLR